MDSIIELRHLKTLLALEETGSVSLAAKRVFLTQSALSHQIRALENYYETPLFERKSTPLRFTPAGMRLLQLARELLPQVAAAERDLVRIIEGEAGELRLAVECHTCFDWLMPAMGEFRPLWPQVELDIVSGFQADPVGLLLQHRADLAIVSEAEPLNGISYRPLFAYEMVGICAEDHPLAEKDVWEAEDFIDETLITYPVPDEMLDLPKKVLLPKGINPSEPMTLETVDRFAREIGFKGRYQLNLPKGETGVWTLSQDSMSYDMISPTADRTVHIDQYSGKILADIHFDDYNWFGKFMAASIALHMGTLGWWSVLANVLFCLAIIFICVSGCVMWWKRRPSEARGLVPPAQKIKLPVWWAMAVPLLILAVIFPTAIAAIAVIWILDTLLLSRIPALARWFK